MATRKITIEEAVTTDEFEHFDQAFIPTIKDELGEFLGTRLHVKNFEQRLKDMKTSDVDMQVLSNTPQTFLYNQDAGMTAAACVVQNDQIAKHVRDYPKSFYGIATLPMQDPKAAADELERSISKLGLKGMQIGSEGVQLLGRRQGAPPRGCSLSIEEMVLGRAGT